MQVKLKLKHPDVKVPTYATDGSGCFDIYADAIDGLGMWCVSVFENNPVIVPTGLFFEIPEGHVMLIFSRSGHGFKNDVRLANCTGIIDSDYRNEILVKLTADGKGEMQVKKGDRIAQGMIIPYPKVQFVVADELSTTERNIGGFGSTGG